MVLNGCLKVPEGAGYLYLPNFESQVRRKKSKQGTMSDVTSTKEDRQRVTNGNKVREKRLKGGLYVKIRDTGRVSPIYELLTTFFPPEEVYFCA